MTRFGDKCAVVGIARTEQPWTPNKTSMDLHAELSRTALEDAGLTKNDVDGVLTAGCDDPTYCEDVAHSAVFCEYMGLKPRFTYSVDLGTPVFAKMIEIAAVAISAGLCNTMLIVSAEPTVSRGSRSEAVEKMTSFGHPEFELPYGISIPAFYALVARRHMEVFGTTEEQLGRVAVAMRNHAALNPSARYRDRISVEDVLASPLIADPLHRLDCCVTTDGGGALLVTTLERARDLKQHPVVIIGSGQGFSHEHLIAAPSLTGFLDEKTRSDMFASAGVSPDDMDLALLYDNFTISVLIQLEDLGFCKPGTAGPFVESGGIDLGGHLPVNPHGGLLSESHPGRAGGIMHLIEAILQLRRTAGPRQVVDAELALVHGVGGILSNQATAIFARH